jgi:hypothetical protein
VKIPDGMKVLFQGKVDYLREIAIVLENGGVRTATGQVPGGWEPRAWLAVASQDATRAVELHRAHLEHMVAREGLPVRDVVSDFDAEETQCPACMTTFKTAGASKCPDCGLHFK